MSILIGCQEEKSEAPIEPTSTENAEALIKIADETKTNPELLHEAPHITPFGRMDEVKAARELVLYRWLPENYSDQLSVSRASEI
jgi:glycine cleavage system protein P-like pyridoxal-binding family